MGSIHHETLILDGVEVWNTWRERNHENTRLAHPDLFNARLGGAHLPGIDLRGADLGRADLIAANLEGSDCQAAYLLSADLRSARLQLANLARADLRNANLEGADCRSVSFISADLTSSNLQGADFRMAELTNAKLCWADLRGANLSRSNLKGANLMGADLRGALINEAVVTETIFGDTDLTDVQGLDVCKHSGPSTVDLRTIAKSAGLPLSFLRGCGLPDRLIEYLPSLLDQAIQFYSCFISYSTQDQAFADRLYADLQNKGVRCWFAPHHIQGGKKIHEQIDEAIRIYDRLLLILSEHSINSQWVQTEIAKARKREVREQRRMLFPVRLVDFETLRDWECFDADTGKDSAREVREYFVPDFSAWKDDDSYQEAFTRLMNDLKAEEQNKT